jgi:hypothetical protein
VWSSRNIPNISENVPVTICALGDIRNHFQHIPDTGSREPAAENERDLDSLPEADDFGQNPLSENERARALH